MKGYIINSPQLQSLHKRLSGIIVWVACWFMWIYLLLPLFTLGGWLLGDTQLVTEMRWFGGYKSLLELLQIYVITLMVIVIFWIGWVLSHTFRPQSLLAAANNTVSDQALCQFYQVKNDELQHCRQSSLITVYFDDNGQIVHLEPTVASPPRAAIKS
jgi:biofilm PGA synthesis protein PgaD